MTVVETHNGVPLRQLLLTIGEPLVRLHTPRTADPTIRGLAILDPDDEPGQHRGELVLIVGARGRKAARIAQAAADAGAAAVAVKRPPAGLTVDPDHVAVLGVAPEMRWHQLAALVQDVLDEAALADGTDGPGDLFALAQSLAVLTAGSVSIEDAGNRVLAYSRSDDVDELRRQSILGWRGPDNYVALLREWGVFHRLRTAEQVVHVDERFELGIRARLAVGIRAGAHHLGTIWVQQGREPFAAQSESALLGAARIAAVHLLRQRTQPGRFPEQLLTDLLDDHASPDLVAGQLGLDPASPVTVVAFGTRQPEPDQPTHELHRNQITTMISMHLLAHRRRALVGRIGPRIYAVLPEAPDPTAMIRDILEVLTTRAGIHVRAGIGSPAPSLGAAAGSRAEADRALDALAPDTAVASIADLRAEVLLAETLAQLTANPDLRDPRVTSLIEHDTIHGAHLVTTLLAYLDLLGDVAATAATLHVHPNTVRHRIRRASAISGVDLRDARQRLACHLQLLTAAGGERAAAPQRRRSLDGSGARFRSVNPLSAARGRRTAHSPDARPNDA